MTAITTADFKKGIFVEFKDETHQIVEFQHVNPGKGSAFVRTKLKSLKSGRVQEFTYKAVDAVTEIPVETHEMQYLYKEGEGFVFMDNQTYEQYTLSAVIIGDFSLFVKPNDTYQVLVHEDEAIGIRFPKKVRLLVFEADDGARGNTATSATKTVKLETGLVVSVPLFIRQGDLVAVDPETGSYLERA